MWSTLRSVVLLSLLALDRTSALQVTPRSSCADYCIDNATAIHSDPNSSNTYGSDIVCLDSDYQNTAVGQKFHKCIDCLQNSTASNTEETDQRWFFYNLRYALQTCLFNDSQAAAPISTACSANETCLPIRDHLEYVMGSPVGMSEYGYCTADENRSFETISPVCESCLRSNNNTNYLANFLVALDAGCEQQPQSNWLVGLNSSLFTNNTVVPTAKINTQKETISSGAIIGITIVCGVVVLVITSAIMSYRQRRHNARLLALEGYN